MLINAGVGPPCFAWPAVEAILEQNCVANQ